MLGHEYRSEYMFLKSNKSQAVVAVIARHEIDELEEEENSDSKASIGVVPLLWMGMDSGAMVACAALQCTSANASVLFNAEMSTEASSKSPRRHNDRH